MWMLWLLLACREEKWQPSLRHVVLIQADTLRMDRLPLYGYERDTMPLLRERPWEIIGGYRSVSSWTLPSTAAVMGGREPHRSGILFAAGSGAGRLPEGGTLAAAFSAAGYQTVIRSGNKFAVNEAYNMRDGFDAAWQESEELHTSNMEALSEDVFQDLDRERPIFLMFQPMDAHAPYSPLPEDEGRWTEDPPFDYADRLLSEHLVEQWEASDAAERERLIREVGALYDEQLPGLDRSIDALFQQMDRAGILEDALIVLTADHGEMLGDDGSGYIGHSDRIWPMLTQVPLMWMGPEVVPGSRQCLGQSHDLAPTLLAAVGIAPPEEMEGVDLGRECRSLTRHVYYSLRAIQSLAVGDDVSYLSWDCAGAALQAWDMRGGMIPVAPSELEGGAALQAELVALIDEVEAAQPEFRCASRP